MKIKRNVFKKLMFTVIIVIMVVILFENDVFVNSYAAIIENESLADSLKLNDDDKAEIIVEFTSPSLLELGLLDENSKTLKYEQKLIDEQNFVLDKLDIIPEFRYTGVMNAAAISATGEEIRQLEQMKEVEDVYISQSFETLRAGDLQQNAMLSSDMMGKDSSITSEYTGDGVLVAVLDSGITFKHEAFNNTKYVKNPKLTSEDVIRLGFNPPAGYYNEKIPFYCDYTASTSDFADENGHGSHVAGIIGGYAEDEYGDVKFFGIAPGAQICAMRVLDEYGVGTDKTIIAALEDAYKLGVDIINISFGRDSAFRLGGSQYISYNGIYENFEKIGVMVICSAGNLGSMAENTPRHVLDENCVDYGTLSLPAIYPGNIGVGSTNNTHIYTQVISIGGQNYRYSDSKENDNILGFKETLNKKNVDIVYFDNYGKKEDYVDIDVTGKIVAVKRGELSFTDKCKFASDAGAIGLIVINGETDSIGGMVINNQSIPAILVENGFANHLPIKDHKLTFKYGLVSILDGGLSYFSAVGVTPDLEIGLDILGVGGSVLSVKSKTVDEYVVYSGTSMAAPSVAGTYAVLYQILKNKDVNGEKSRADIANYMDDVTQSTATILTDDFGNKYSPRFQGAGLIDIEKAASAEAYITTPLVCLGYDKEASGSVSMEYELVNLSNEEKKYTALVSAITDSFTQISPTDYKNHVTPFMLDNSSYTYKIYINNVAIPSDGKITIPPMESIIVKIELELASNVANSLSKAFPYGYFLDGFVEFYDITNPSEVAMHGGYVSFVGDWLEAPAVEPLTQSDVMDWIHSIGVGIDELLPYFAAGHINANYSYTALLLGDGNHYIGENPLADGQYIPSYTDRNAISAAISDANKIIYDSLNLYPSLLRSCKSIRYVVTNSNTGEIYLTETQEYVIKDIPVGNYQYFPLSSFIFEPIYSAPNEFGQITERYIPTGTDVTISIYTLLDHPDAQERLEAEYKVTIDYTAPKFYYNYDADTKTLTVKCTDNEYLAGIVLEEVDDDYNIGTKIESRIYADKTPGLEYIEVFDLSNYNGNNISITISDYASNLVTTILSISNGSVSNIESSVTTEDEINIDFEKKPYIYQEFDFAITPQEGYCFTKDFKISVNGEEVIPTIIENGIYYYTITPTDEEIIITSNGASLHNFVSTVTKEATCTSEGEIAHICSNCSYVGKTEVIEKKNHTKGAEEVVVEPTCSDPGLSVVKCRKCDIILETKIISANASLHNFVSTVTKEATCTSEGEIAHICSNCSYVGKTEVIEKKNHTKGAEEVVVEPTCSDPGLSVVKCTNCDTILETKIIPANASLHNFVSTVTKEATCTSEGEIAHICSNCSYVGKTEVIEKKNHTKGAEEVVVEPTCSDPGLSVVKCTNCDTILETKIIPAKGHDNTLGKEATALSPAVCGVCGQSYGMPNSKVIIILTLSLSIISAVATTSIAVMIFMKKKKDNRNK